MYEFECITNNELEHIASKPCSPEDEPCYPFASCPPEHDCGPWDD